MTLPDRDVDRDAAADVRVVLRPIGTPLPLGFLALSAGCLVLSGLALGWVPVLQQHQVALVLIAFVFPLQLVAAVFGFLGRDAVVGSGVGVLAGSWLSIGVLLYASPAGATDATLGLFLFVAAAALVPAIAVAGSSKLLPAIVMSATAIRFTLTGIYERTGSTLWEHLSGWEGLAVTVLALYAATALDLESARLRTVLPVLRMGSGRRALGAPLADQIAYIQHEAGVRREL